MQISNATTGAVLDTETVSSFASGVYLQWVVSGNILITITRWPGPMPCSAACSSTRSQSRRRRRDRRAGTATEGNWIGTYGAQGYDVIGSAASLPSYATVTPSGPSSYTWAASTTDPRALQDAGGTGRIAACWYSATSFTVDVDLTDGQMHDLELYFLDWDNRSERAGQISNAATGAVLDTETVSSFPSGVYLQWAVSGNILITITVAGANAVLSGLFLDPTPTSPTTGRSSSRTDDGGELDRDLRHPGLRRHRQRGQPAQLRHHRALGRVDLHLGREHDRPRALQNPGGTGRIAACLVLRPRFTVDVDLTDGQTHDLELYFLDWETRSQRAGADQQRHDGGGAGYGDDLVVRLGRLPGVGGQREHVDHVHVLGRAQCHPQWPVPRPGAAARRLRPFPPPV